MRALNKLTTLGVKHLNKPGLHGDGGGLYLQISETGAKSWIFRFMIGGRAREMGLGSVSTFTLAEARERARLQRQLLADGVDPIEHRKAKQAETELAKAQTVAFEDCAKRYIDAHKSGWKSGKHADQWTSTLRTWAYPIIGKLSVGGITTTLVMKVLQQPVGNGPDAPTFWNARTETASRVRGRIEKVLDWARAQKMRDGENPARWKGLLENLLPARSQVSPVEHRKALPYADIPKFMAELRRRDSVSARALEFTVLTAARTGDTIGAKRSEIDDKSRTWTVPAARLKGRRGARRRDHVVPLSDRAIEILDDLGQDADYLFANENGDPLSNMAMLELLQGMGFGEDLTVHGFRSTFKDWCAEQTAYPNEMSEMALAHTVSDKVEAAYRRGDMRERRRRLMTDWARYCASPPSKARQAATDDRVVALRTT
jgi:integrase